VPGHSPGLGLPYDPEGACKLLAEAGYSGGRGFPIGELLTNLGDEPVCDYLQAQWRENLGLETSWENMDCALLQRNLYSPDKDVIIEPH
jgi:ABC-type transport system substrate-binding protein